MRNGTGGFGGIGAGVIVQTPSGRSNVTCTVTGVSNTTGRAVHWDFENTGNTCGGGTDWKQTLSASGNAKLVCHIDG
jgi:hypothetical protein